MGVLHKGVIVYLIGSLANYVSLFCWKCFEWVCFMIYYVKDWAFNGLLEFSDMDSLYKGVMFN